MRNEAAVVKSKFIPEVLANLKEGEVFPFVKILDLSERCFNINHEKSKIARSMESRMSQMRKNQRIKKEKKFSNQSFTSMMNNGEVVCGTVLTCIESQDGSNQADTDLTAIYAQQMMQLGTAEALPIVKVVDPSASFVDVNVVKQVVSMMTEQSINIAKRSSKDGVSYVSEEFCGTLSNGNLVIGNIIRKQNV